MAEISIGQAEAFAEERVRLRSLAMTWSALLMLLLPILGLLGLFMRSYQTQALLEVVDVSWFYASMTLHGLGFVGLSYTVSFVAMLYVLSRHAVAQSAGDLGKHGVNGAWGGAAGHLLSDAVCAGLVLLVSAAVRVGRGLVIGGDRSVSGGGGGVRRSVVALGAGAAAGDCLAL